MGRMMIGIFGALVAAAVTPAQERSDVVTEPPDREALVEANRAALEALKTFSALLTRENYRSMGFDSPEQARTAEIGAPLPAFMIRLDELRGYEVPAAPTRLLHRNGELTFPIRVGERTVSSLVLVRTTAAWRPVSFGGPNRIRLLDEARTRVAAAEGRSLSDYSEVRIPALNLVFLASQDGERVSLTPIVDDARLGIERGVTVPMDKLLPALVRAAREHNDLPT